MLNVGDKVELLQDIAPLRHRKKPVYGKVTAINGAYIYVRPMWCIWEIEAYEHELRKV